jgi:hypothetical protein
VPDEFYFMSMGGLGLSLAGFAGLIAALGPKDDHVEIAAWRIVTVVKFGLHVTFLGFGTIALFAVVADVSLTVRIVTGVAILTTLRLNDRASIAGPGWTDEHERIQTRRLMLLLPLAGVPNLFLAHVGYLQIILLGLLALPAGTLITAVTALTAGARSTGESD